MTRATISDVARLSDVSMKSVSRVINREPNVSEKLRARVQSAIDVLGYVPDLAARSLAGARSFAISILFEDYGDRLIPSYFPNVQAGVYKACRDHGYHLLVEALSSDGDGFEVRLGRLLDTMRIDGLILAPPYSDNPRAMDVLLARKIPYTRIAPFEDQARAPFVAIDDHAAACELTRYLWDLGHRRFGFASGRPEHGAAQARRRGFAETLATLGRSDFIEAYAGFDFELGIGAAKIIMADPDPPTVIFAANDDSAAGIMSGLAQLDLKVPDDVSVAGFDNSWIARSVWPYLTTVHQPIAEMGYVAAMQLIARNGQFEADRMPAIKTELIVRGSTAPPKGGV